MALDWGCEREAGEKGTGLGCFFMREKTRLVEGLELLTKQLSSRNLS